MDDMPREELYRIPGEGSVPLDSMSDDEIALRKLLVRYSKDPENPELLMGITRILMRRGLYEEARLYLDPCLEKTPDDPEALNYAGVIRCK